MNARDETRAAIVARVCCAHCQRPVQPTDFELVHGRDIRATCLGCGEVTVEFLWPADPTGRPSWATTN